MLRGKAVTGQTCDCDWPKDPFWDCIGRVLKLTPWVSWRTRCWATASGTAAAGKMKTVSEWPCLSSVVQAVLAAWRKKQQRRMTEATEMA